LTGGLIAENSDCKDQKRERASLAAVAGGGTFVDYDEDD
jgi:hypothetical protein